MPITYTIDPENKLITEVWVGAIDAACLADYWSRLLADQEVMEIRKTLVDLRRADILFTGPDLLRLIQTLVLPALRGRHWKSALVVENRPNTVSAGSTRRSPITTARTRFSTTWKRRANG
jgi:hypothetical protein